MLPVSLYADVHYIICQSSDEGKSPVWFKTFLNLPETSPIKELLVFSNSLHQLFYLFAIKIDYHLLRKRKSLIPPFLISQETAVPPAAKSVNTALYRVSEVTTLGLKIRKYADIASVPCTEGKYIYIYTTYAIV